MSAIVVGMPQTDLGGLSESWLLRHAGDRHWQLVVRALGARGVDSPELRDEATGLPLYPTFIALRARYSAPLRAVTLDQRLRTRGRVAAFGRAFFHGRITVATEEERFDFDLLTAFVARDREGENGLHLAGPPPWVRYRAAALETAPALLLTSQALRRTGTPCHEIAGFRLPSDGPPLAESGGQEPSPYTDFNAAGLLYFAAYATLADTLERQLVHRLGLLPHGSDWARTTSTVARDIFYQRNLDLGTPLVARLLRVERRGREVALATHLVAADTGATLAQVFTVKQLAGDSRFP